MTDSARIHVVEDSPVVALHIQRFLERSGYRVSSVVASGEEAVENVAASPPDLVLMDIQLEGPMDGIEAARVIWERFSVPVVYLTANSDRATFSRAVGGAPYGYLVKPFDERTLQATVEVALRRYQDERARLDAAEQTMSMHTRELSLMGHALEQHINQLSGAQGIGNDLAARVATMVDTVTEVVIAVQTQRTAARDAMDRDERGEAPPVEIVDEMAALVNAMTDVVRVVRTRLIPMLKLPADGGEDTTLRKAV